MRTYISLSKCYSVSILHLLDMAFQDALLSWKSSGSLLYLKHIISHFPHFFW